MKYVSLVIALAALGVMSGCLRTSPRDSDTPKTTLRDIIPIPKIEPPVKYGSGSNYGDSGKTECGTRTTTDGYLPWCLPPDDGDEWDNRPQYRNQTFNR